VLLKSNHFDVIQFADFGSKEGFGTWLVAKNWF